MRKTVLKRLITFTQSLEFRRGVEAEQQKTPDLAAGGSCSGNEAED